MTALRLHPRKNISAPTHRTHIGFHDFRGRGQSGAGTGLSGGTVGASSAGTAGGSTSTSATSGAGSTSGSGSSGRATTGGTADAGPCGGAGMTEFGPCGGASGISICACGQSCVDDPVFAAFVNANQSEGVCEAGCVNNTDCDNAGSRCTTTVAHGSICVPNICDAGVGEPCVANNGTTDGGPGTCVAQSGLGVSVCMPNGAAVSCYDGPRGITNDVPLQGSSVFQLDSQPSSNLALYCGAGDGCLWIDPRSSDVVDRCARLCSTSSPSECGNGERV
jgi:hypothetical protein